MRRLAIYGLGLIGGSLAKALRARGAAPSLVGIDFASVIGSDAAKQAVDELVDASDERAVEQAFAAADLAVLATPVRAVERALPVALAACSAVTDCGSTKRSIVEVARSVPRSAARFVGGHPMAGAPEGGLANARADLFEGSRWIVCPAETAANAETVTVVSELIARVGATAVHMSAAEHDRAVALTSHVPQLIASALAALAVETDVDAAAGPAFAGATRVAGGPEPMWRDIFETNADEIAKALALLSARLDAVGRSLPDVGPALELLREARSLRRE